LIVNDDDDIANLFAAALQSDGFKVNVSHNAALALEKIKSNPDEFSLILIDRTSQQELDFPKLVKAISDRMKVILASAFAFNEPEIAKSDYDMILQLPVTMSKLVTTVRGVLYSDV
jgi:DNA-binding NtrC family response regulator